MTTYEAEKSFLSLDELGDKIKNIGKKNQVLLGNADSSGNELLVCGYSVTLSNVLPESTHQDRDVGFNWNFKKEPSFDYARDRLAAWEYSSEPLEEPEDIFNDNIEYTLKNISDVRRLNKDLPKVGDKCAMFLADKPRTRELLSVFVKNMEKIQKAVEEISELTTDLEDMTDENVEISEGLNEIAAGMKILTKNMPEANISFSATYFVGKATQSLVSIENPEAITCKKTITSNFGVVHALASFRMNDESYLASAGGENTVKVRTLTGFEETLSGHTGQIFALSTYSVKNDFYMASAGDDTNIIIWSLIDNSAIHILKGHKSAIWALSTIQMQGVTHLASAGHDKAIRLWNMESLSVVATLSSDSKVIWALSTYEVGSKVFLASGESDSNINIWNLETSTVAAALDGHSKHVRALTTFSHNNTPCLASGSSDHTIKLWNLSDYSLFRTLKGHVNSVISLTTFLHNKTVCLASGGHGDFIKLWDLTTMSVINTLTGHKCGIMALVTLMNGTTPSLVSGSGDWTIKLWQVPGNDEDEPENTVEPLETKFVFEGINLVQSDDFYKQFGEKTSKKVQALKQDALEKSICSNEIEDLNSKSPKTNKWWRRRKDPRSVSSRNSPSILDGMKCYGQETAILNNDLLHQRSQQLMPMLIGKVDVKLK